MASNRNLRHPTKWETPNNRTANNATKNLAVSGLRVKYTGPGGVEDKDAASVRSDHPVPQSCGFYYFEIQIVGKGRGGFVGVGFAAKGVGDNRLPGWDSHSYGYHGDDGHAFRNLEEGGGRSNQNSGKGTEYGPTFTSGDVIGAYLNQAEQTISYTKNGIDLGVAFKNVKEKELFPTVGMRTHDEEVMANFGEQEFVADVAGLRQDAASRIQASISNTELPNGKVGAHAPEELIFNYLTHHGYLETAAVVSAELLQGRAVSPTHIEDTRACSEIFREVAEGSIDAALQLTEAAAPGALAASPAVLFRLHCQQFAQMVSRGEDDVAMAFGREVLSQGARSPDEQELLSETLSLIAYPEPSRSPCGHLLGVQHRTELATSLNAAIFAFKGRKTESALETIYRQLRALHEELGVRGVPHASLADFDSVFKFSN